MCGAAPANPALTSYHSKKKWVVAWSPSFLVEGAGGTGADLGVEVSDFWARCVSGTPGWGEECGWQGGQSLMALE